MQYYIVFPSDYMIPSLFTYVLLLGLHEHLLELLHNTLHPITCLVTWFNMRLHDSFFIYICFTFRIRWIPPKATCLPSSVLVVTFCVPLVKGKDELVSGFRGPALIRFCYLQCHDLGGVSTVCPQLPSLSWAIFIVWNERWSSAAPFSSDFEHLQGTEVPLLRNQEDHESEDHKSFNWSSCSYLLLHILLI